MTCILFKLYMILLLIINAIFFAFYRRNHKDNGLEDDYFCVTRYVSICLHRKLRTTTQARNLHKPFQDHLRVCNSK